MVQVWAHIYIYIYASAYICIYAAEVGRGEREAA